MKEAWGYLGLEDPYKLTYKTVSVSEPWPLHGSVVVMWLTGLCLLVPGSP